MVNGNDFLEFEEQNFEDLIEDFLTNKENHTKFEEWLWDYGYNKFLIEKDVIKDWTAFVEKEFNERSSE